ncbi:MAG TPA: helix-hairpin-helix domain-containing protein [Thermoanaerobaculia bacterium]|nr:helix-hairpin-helix domain-containing protein [Thermoanaerobaculia bacterium]
MTLRHFVRAFTAPALALAIAALSAPVARAEGDSGNAPASKVVNINQASSNELARLPRVGAKLADRIVAHRTQHGSFKRIEDLMEVKGVGEKMFTKLKPYLTVSGATTLAEKVSSAGSRGGRSRGAGKGGKGSRTAPEKG